MTDKKYSLPQSIVVDQTDVWAFDGTDVVNVPTKEVWYSIPMGWYVVHTQNALVRT